MYENGDGVTQSIDKSLEFYGKACDLKEELGCEHYANLKNN